MENSICLKRIKIKIPENRKIFQDKGDNCRLPRIQNPGIMALEDYE